MAVREIVTVGHPVLRERAREVTADELATPEVQQLIDDLVDTMHAANGAGIAANQVGVPLRITTIEVNDNPRYPVQATHPIDGGGEPPRSSSSTTNSSRSTRAACRCRTCAAT